MVLQTAAVLISLAWAVVIASVFYFFQSADPSLQVEATLLGVLCFVMAWMVQAFVASVLLNVVDATFFCYAVDKTRTPSQIWKFTTFSPRFLLAWRYSSQVVSMHMVRRSPGRRCTAATKTPQEHSGVLSPIACPECEVNSLGFLALFVLPWVCIKNFIPRKLGIPPFFPAYSHPVRSHKT
eukprot:jgi/Botrbrau1/20950/Bobra.0135s0069.1